MELGEKARSHSWVVAVEPWLLAGMLGVFYLLYIWANALACVSNVCGDATHTYALADYVRRAPRYSGGAAVFGTLYGVVNRLLQASQEAMVAEAPRATLSALGTAGLAFLALALSVPSAPDPFYMFYNSATLLLWGTCQFCWTVRQYLVASPPVMVLVFFFLAVGIAVTLAVLSLAHILFSDGPPPEPWNHYRAALQAIAMGFGVAGNVLRPPSAITVTVKRELVVAAYSVAFVGFFAVYLASCAPAGACASRTSLYSLSQFVREQPDFLGVLCVWGSAAFLLQRLIQAKAEDRRSKTCSRWAAPCGWVALSAALAMLATTGVSDKSVYWTHLIFVLSTVVATLGWAVLMLWDAPRTHRKPLYLFGVGGGLYVGMLVLDIANSNGYAVPSFPANHIYAFLETLGLVCVFSAHVAIALSE